MTSTNIRTKVISSREKQASYYNQIAKPLQDLKAGNVVQLKLPGQNYWSKVSVRIKQHPDPIWLSVMDIHTYQRNHKDLRSTSDLKPETQDIDVPLTADSTSRTLVTSIVDIME